MTHDPLIVSIKRHSLEDGPGIRSVVFFKGCPMRCVFCHNPETREPGYEIGFSAERCLQCGACAEACPRSAIELSLPGRIRRQACRVCGDCAAACPTGALTLIGTPYRVEELTEVLLRDLKYYRHSGGGVTLSGGEPTLYPEFLCRLLRRLKEWNVHTCLETCGYYDHGAFSRMILPYLDLVYFDLKLAAPGPHRQYTGKSNRRILHNLSLLQAERPALLQVRVPLVPGITATGGNLRGIRDLLLEIGIRNVSFLPYNPLGKAIGERLGRQPFPISESFMTAAEEDRAVSLFLSSANL